MTEIEKMFENANIKKIHKYQIEIDNGDPRFTGIGHSDSYIVYPDFTAEKQIELIKWLASKQYAKYTTSLLINIRDTVRFAGGLIAGTCTLNVKYDKQDKEFENALAGVINEMWQDLTDQEKEEIRGILNE
jgi:hypothetical protein